MKNRRVFFVIVIFFVSITRVCKKAVFCSQSGIFIFLVIFAVILSNIKQWIMFQYILCKI